MSSKNLKYILLAVFTVFMLWFFSDVFTRPGLSQFSGDFEEVTMYRNENNTGPIQRIYIVSAVGTHWEQMELYGNYLPHTKYGTTKVYYFLKGQPAPQKAYPGPKNFDPEFEQDCLAMYEKDAMGQVKLVKWPFR